MVNLLDTKISAARLALRVVIALLLSVLSLSALYIAPRALMDYMRSIPDAQLQSLMNQLLNPTVLSLGLLVSALVFIMVTLRKTRLEGPLLICLGAALLSFWYLFLHGGTITVPIPVAEAQQAMGFNVPMSIQADVTADVATLMLAAMCPAILIISKGALLTAARLRKA